MAYSVFEPGSYDGDVVGIDQSVAVDVAVAYVTFKVTVALAQTGVIHVRGEVVVVDFTVVVDVAGEVAFGSGYFEDVEFTSGAVVSDCFGDGYFHVAGSRPFGEGEYFSFTVSFPFKFACFCPVFFVEAGGDFSFEDGSVSGIGTRQVEEFVKLVDGAEVGDYFARYGFFSIFGVPCVFFVEVE